MVSDVSPCPANSEIVDFGPSRSKIHWNGTQAIPYIPHFNFSVPIKDPPGDAGAGHGPVQEPAQGVQYRQLADGDLNGADPEGGHGKARLAQKNSQLPAHQNALNSAGMARAIQGIPRSSRMEPQAR